MRFIYEMRMFIYLSSVISTLTQTNIRTVYLVQHKRLFPPVTSNIHSSSSHTLSTPQGSSVCFWPRYFTLFVHVKVNYPDMKMMTDAIYSSAPI